MTKPEISTLTEADVNFLRKLVREPDFRSEFLKTRERTHLTTREGLSPAGSRIAASITPVQLDGLTRAANAVGQARADDNCTLVYAVAFAVAFALAIA